MTYALHNTGSHTHDHGLEATQDREHRLIVSLDSLGIFASSLCLVHCLAMPLIIGFLPILGWGFLEGHKAHVILAFFVLAFALTAVVPGYLQHRRKDILISMLFGLALVLSATFALPETWELPTITVGNLLLVATHLRNRSLHKHCAQHSH